MRLRQSRFLPKAVPEGLQGPGLMEHEKMTGETMGPNAAAPPRPQAGLVELFLLFSGLGLSSFGGGVSAWMHRTFVEQRGWLPHTEFAAAMALSRIMPGANVIN